MCKFRYLVLVLLLMVAACAPPTQQIVVLPTLAALPTTTPAPTYAASPTESTARAPTQTHTPTSVPPSATPNLMETQVALLQATNEAAQATLNVLLTRSVSTQTLSITLTLSHTITQTLTPSLTLSPTRPVVAMQPQLIYVRSAANLRTCASRDCESIAQLETGATVMATGSIQGEVVSSGDALWYRVDYAGREVYIYGRLISLAPPTSVPVVIQPPTSAPISVAPPVALPQGGGSCPDITASCSVLTCEQAYACLAAGNGRLDGDNDGTPCESICN